MFHFTGCDFGETHPDLLDYLHGPLGARSVGDEAASDVCALSIVVCQVHSTLISLRRVLCVPTVIDSLRHYHPQPSTRTSVH